MTALLIFRVVLWQIIGACLFMAFQHGNSHAGPCAWISSLPWWVPLLCLVLASMLIPFAIILPVTEGGGWGE